MATDPFGRDRRRLLLAGVAGSAWSPLAWPQSPGASSRILRVVGPWEINGIDPAIGGHLFSRMQVAETLTEAEDGGRPLPGLASAWAVSDDLLRWRFTLRPGAWFHDGTPVTAAPVVQVLQRAAARPGILKLAAVADIAAEGDAVVIRLASPFSALPALLAHSSLQILAPQSFDGQGRVKAIIGSGPYRIARLEPPQGFEVVSFKEWTGPRPAVARASYLSVSRAETRALMIEGGQADLAYGLDPASIERLRRHPRASIVAVTIPRTVLLKLNAGHRWLSDLRARQALSLALDRAGIARALLRDPEMAASQLFPPTLAEWHVPGLAPLRHDPAESRRLWAQLGWQPGSDGMLARSGERLRLSLRTFPDRPELPLMAAAIQEQCRQVGVEVRILIGNSSDIPAAHRAGSLEMALVPRNFALVPDPMATVIQDYGRPGGKAGGDWGAMNWRDPELPPLLDELVRTPDAPRRAALRTRAAAILQAELPVIPVSWYRQTAAVGERITGVSVDPLERSYRLTGIAWKNTSNAAADRSKP